MLSINRLFTDQVIGFGRRQIVEAMAEHLEELREALEKPAKDEQ